MKHPIALLIAAFAGLFAYKVTEMISAFLGGFFGHMFRVNPVALQEFLFPFLGLGLTFLVYRIWRGK